MAKQQIYTLPLYEAFADTTALCMAIGQVSWSRSSKGQGHSKVKVRVT